MAFSSRLKRKNEAVSAAHDRARRDPEIENLLLIARLHGHLDALYDRALALAYVEPVCRQESDAVLTEIKELKALISELRNG